MKELQLLDPEKNQVIQHLYMNELRQEIQEAIEGLPEKCNSIIPMGDVSFMDIFSDRIVSY